MSLRSMITDSSAVRQGFGAKVLRPQVRFERGLQAPPLTGNFQPLAGAFDYLLRFCLQRLNPQARDGAWAAERGVEVIQLAGGDGGASKDVPTVSRHPHGLKAAAFLSDARRRHRAYLQSGQVTQDLLMAVHHLAHLDVASRDGAGRVDWHAINYLSPDDAADLKALLALVDENAFRTTGPCVLKPVVPAAGLAGGASPDLILDRCLIEVRTGKDARIDVRDYFLLIGHYLLVGLGGIAGAEGRTEQCPIASIGIYYARFGQLWKVPVREVLPPAAVPDLTRWFVEAACAANQPGPEVLKTLTGPLAAHLYDGDGALIPAAKTMARR
jgi:hypothetical protein